MKRSLRDLIRRGFDGGEKATAEVLEVALRSPVVLEPVGAALTRLLRAKHGADRLVERGWRALGLVSRRDYERALHALNEIQSKLLDLEEQARERDRA